jgi:hypothetical protein
VEKKTAGEPFFVTLSQNFDMSVQENSAKKKVENVNKDMLISGKMVKDPGESFLGSGTFFQISEKPLVELLDPNVTFGRTDQGNFEKEHLPRRGRSGAPAWRKN